MGICIMSLYTPYILEIEQNELRGVWGQKYNTPKIPEND